MAKHNIVGQGLGAEMIAEEYEIPRPELDELALRSHQLAHRATEEGRFEREIIPMQVDGDTYVSDQGIRPDTTLEALSKLRTVFKEDGVDHRGELLADLRRRRCGAADERREGRRARPDAACADHGPDDRRV